MDRARVLVWDPRDGTAGIINLREWGFEGFPDCFELPHKPMGAFSFGGEGPLTQLPELESTLFVRRLVQFEDEVLPIFVAHRDQPEPDNEP